MRTTAATILAVDLDTITDRRKTADTGCRDKSARQYNSLPVPSVDYCNEL